MSVKITVSGNIETNEFKDAVDLKEIFTKELSKDINGEILIISNATLFGQDTKDVDLVVMGFFENYDLFLNVPAKEYLNCKYIDGSYKNRNVLIKSFCFVIETKRQEAVNIKLEGLVLKVKYKDKYHDVTTQSEKQKYALKKYLDYNINYSPYICNFIWFRSIDGETINNLVGIDSRHNYLPNAFNLNYLFSHACIQSSPIKPKNSYSNNYYFSCVKEANDVLEKMKNVFDLFEKKCSGYWEFNKN